MDSLSHLNLQPDDFTIVFENHARDFDIKMMEHLNRNYDFMLEAENVRYVNFIDLFILKVH